MLSDDERTKINYYLSTKWGLESTVDSDGDGVLDIHETSGATDPSQTQAKADFANELEIAESLDFGLESGSEVSLYLE